MKILREFHPTSCTCSFCRELGNSGHRSFGFLAPQDKAWNAWRWVFYVTRNGIRYWRWNGFWQRQPIALKNNND
jgi:hypothetical protein